MKIIIDSRKKMNNKKDSNPVKWLEEQLLVSWDVPEKLNSSIRRNREGFGRGGLGFHDPLF